MASTLSAGSKPGKAAELPAGKNRPDEELVRECLQGNQEAWADLIDKYKNLIYSVPIKYGFSREEAGDIFQEVCLGLLSELKSIREPKALAKWLLMVTAHKCFRWKKRAQRLVSLDSEEDAPGMTPEVPPEAQEIVVQAEREQMMRNVISALPTRCKELVHMLFFEDPPVPYQEVAERLGIATGSIGFIRQRCLGRLKKSVTELRVTW